MRRVRVIVTGIVQGVGFRFATRRAALDLDLTGWVRNVGADRVEAHVQGPEARVDEMIRWLRHGPPSAIVATTEESDQRVRPDETGFAILASRL